MKIAIYLVLALLLFSAILTPLTEVFVLGKDKLLLSSTLYNSFRAAKEASYFYHEMRTIDAMVDLRLLELSRSMQETEIL